MSQIDTPTQLKRPIDVGDQIPTFSAPSTSGKPLTLDELVGKPLILFFLLRAGGEDCAAELRGFRDLYSDFQKLGAHVVAVCPDTPRAAKTFAEGQQLPFPMLVDPQMKLCAACGVMRAEQTDAGPQVSLSRSTYLTDWHFRVLKRYDDVAAPNHAQEVLADANKLLFPEEAREIIQHAPVLLIRDAFPRDLCRQLVELWESQNEDSGFMKQIDGKTVGMVDYGHKIRRDHFMQPGPLEDAVKRYLTARILPLVKQAFNYDVTRREDFRIACYDASRGGYFRPHRDNTTAGTAHRRFAISLLLNDDYEGGYLRFPEYGMHLYRPRAGDAVVFSCSLLHEATDVTAGRRFVLLSFFYGEREAKIREEYNRQAGGAYRA